MDEIILNGRRKKPAREAQDISDSDCNDNDIYQIEETSFEETKEKLEWRECAFEFQQQNS